jgi:hypothetical protein
MISPLKIALEALILIVALGMLRKFSLSSSRRFFLIFAAVALVLNTIFYYVAAWPLYASYGESSGLGQGALHSLIIFDIAKWCVLAFFLSRLSDAIAQKNLGGGFALLRPKSRIGSTIGIGILSGLIATAAVYGLSFLEQHYGYLEEMPWRFFADNPVYQGLGFWGGIRNLAGEEIIVRLGAQSILLFVFRKTRGAPLFAIILSSLFFEIWHNGFHELYFMNFIGSCVLGLAYHIRGYESAAIGHCVADWVSLLILPKLLF